MIERFVIYVMFMFERIYCVLLFCVFVVWVNLKAKVEWFFVLGEFESLEYEFDFRVGGCEYFSVVVFGGGLVYMYDVRYQDIVDNECIVMIYEMHMDVNCIFVLVVMVEFQLVFGGIWFVMTEQGVYFDGYDKFKDCEQGIFEFLDQLGEYFECEVVGV